MAETEDKAVASQRVADDLRARIESGEFKVGDALPTRRDLAAEYGVAPNTATVAVRLLQDVGLVTIQRNAKARVRDRSADVDTSALLRATGEEVSALKVELAQAAERLAEVEKTLAELARRTTP
ncbi:winged helix-turn-helix domain-containing protein [Prauserella muralis]|uniref:HTH gntR-type domain-containing protein n=1 Tax=Prauserella muralis TaxID=588067 RepID=A0A2V4BM18_9PSEU|nr:winged helix-turn-helix domain-containing protein [Prauserella muralis]PXY31693.1 hypothetical protein BAY60_04845 [Prauserella muralis]